MLFIHDATTVEINPWGLAGHPIIIPNLKIKTEDVASSLLHHAADFAKTYGFSRLDLTFPCDRPDNQPFRVLYESCGMKLVDETVILKRELADGKRPKESLPKDIEIKPLTEISQEKLYESWCEMFESAQIRFFANRTEEERVGFFKESFSFSEPFIKDSSLAIISNDPEEAIVGFSLVRPTHGEGNGQLWQFGIHPNYRRRGLGEKLLVLVMEKLLRQGFKTIGVGVDPENHP
ncbi:MAG: GNAT family N-acetyltransferase, partial [Candidatus Hodarchaeota archaeon]